MTQLFSDEHNVIKAAGGQAPAMTHWEQGPQTSMTGSASALVMTV